MGEIVYRNYDAETLWSQYNNRGQIEPAVLDAIKNDQNVRSAAMREGGGRKHLDVSYGPHDRERLDVYLPDSDGAPLFAFMHGGYWQWNDKEGFDFLARELLAAGSAFANIEYALCPSVTLAELTNQCRRALAHLWREGDRYGYDRSQIVVSGHSAGGHLTAMMAATDWPDFGDDLPVELVAASLPISGIFDVEPVRLTPLNDAVRLASEDVAELSPMFLKPRSHGRTVIAYGDDEYDEFHRQADDLAAHWAAHGVDTSTLPLPGRDHFTALSALAETDHPLFRKALELLKLD